MAINEISSYENNKLRAKIRRLPFGEKQRSIYENSLAELYKKYKSQFAALTETIRLYKDIAELVNEQEPLVKERKYLIVRKPEPV